MSYIHIEFSNENLAAMLSLPVREDEIIQKWFRNQRCFLQCCGEQITKNIL